MNLESTEIGSALRRIIADLTELADGLEAPGQVLERKYIRNLGEKVRHEDISPRLAGLSASEYHARRIREKHIPIELLGEPGWDMLLDLYMSYCEGKRLHSTSLCIASMVPPTTALRWITNLVNAGLAVRTKAVHDTRVTYVELSEQGITAMARCLKEQDDTLSKRSAHDPAIPFGIMSRDDYTRSE